MEFTTLIANALTANFLTAFRFKIMTM